MNGKRTESAIRWNIIAAVAGGPIITGVLIWQLWDLTPAKYCTMVLGAAKDDVHGADFYVGCIVKLLEIKDHVLIGLLAIIGISFVSVVIVAIKGKVSATGPGGIEITVGGEDAEDNP